MTIRKHAAAAMAVLLPALALAGEEKPLWEVGAGVAAFSFPAALTASRASQAKKPRVLVINTRKGNRVPGLENAPLSHVTAIKPDLIDRLLEESK